MKREDWIQSSSAYYNDIALMLNYFIPEGSKVLEVGCSSGWLLEQVQSRASKLVGIDMQYELIQEATLKRGHNIEFIHGNFENIQLEDRFDFIIISDVIPFAKDIQLLLENAYRHLAPGGRVFISAYNSYLKPLFSLGEMLGLKQKSSIENWLTKDDLYNLADLANFEVIRQGHRAMSPWNCAGIGRFLNRYVAPLPCFAFTNLYFYALLRPQNIKPEQSISKVSVIVPARNEAGNIAAAVSRLPQLAPEVELIYVEGNSKDNTWEMIQKTLSEPHPSWLSLKAFKQSGKGKANAVHKGFAEASGDVLMILDADLTVPPEELPRFLKPLADGKADFSHGSRLIYPMEKNAMRFLNIFGNKFFSLCFSFLLGQRFKDTLCGTKVLWRTDWPRILELRNYFGDFDPFGDFEMLFGAAKLNKKIAEIPVHYKDRTYGETNISRFRHGLILLKMVIFAAPRMKFI